MISVEEAKELIIKSAGRLAPVKLSISNCLFHVLCQDVLSPVNYPPFNQSAMDGYAFLFSDFKEQKSIEVIGEAPAGSPFQRKITSSEAVRVFTGAKIPEAADTVVMQEKIKLENGKLLIHDKDLVFGANVRKKGSHIKEGDIALKSGTVLTPAAIGFLASLGITSVNVIPAPKVSIIITGNELQKPGKPLIDGQVYESNAITLQMALASINIPSAKIFSIPDDEIQTIETIRLAISDSDLVLISGGVSVGKYDYVSEAMRQAGVKEIFYKVYQKPGKPLFFGKHNNCLLYGLPGNPAAALTCFYEYVYPALRIMQGQPTIFLKQIQLPTTADYNKLNDLSLYLKGKILNGSVEILEGQESNNTSSFAVSDCLVYLPEGKANLLKGHPVEVHLLP